MSRPDGVHGDISIDEIDLVSQRRNPSWIHVPSAASRPPGAAEGVRDAPRGGALLPRVAPEVAGLRGGFSSTTAGFDLDPSPAATLGLAFDELRNYTALRHGIWK
jgi:hypothetical protein